jgi:hypothetical protein
MPSLLRNRDSVVGENRNWFALEKGDPEMGLKWSCDAVVMMRGL